MMLASLEEKIARLEAALVAEQASIDAAIAAHQIGAGYWQRRHEICRRLLITRTLRDAIAEVAA
jgi:hypothetical protein